MLQSTNCSFVSSINMENVRTVEVTLVTFNSNGLNYRRVMKIAKANHFFTKMFIPGSKFWSPVKMCTLRTFEVVECMKWLQRWLKFQYFVNNPVNRSFFKRIIRCLNIIRKYYVKTMSQLQFKIIREKTVGFDGFNAKLLLIRIGSHSFSLNNQSVISNSNAI